MNNLSILSMPGAQAGADRLAAALHAARCALDSRRFPDGEIYLRVADDVAGRDVAVVAELRDPDPQLPGLLFVADALHELGAASVGLVAPYLPYMRQDKRFHAGEAIASHSVGKLLSTAFDWLVTVDPHLHRTASLTSVCSIPSTAVASAPAVADWLHHEVDHAFLLGPDEESAQWVGEVAKLAHCSFAVLHKRRLGDRSVVLELPDLPAAARGRNLVLVDDIIASGRTMAGAVLSACKAGFAPPVCLSVHAVCAGDAATLLAAAGAARLVSCNTLAHPSNAIDVTHLLAAAVGAAVHRVRESSIGGPAALAAERRRKQKNAPLPAG